MKENITIWVGTEFYFPEINYATGYYLTAISEYLADHCNVNVVCFSPKNLDGKLVDREIINNVKINRLVASNLNKNKIIPRILRFILLSIRFFRFFYKNVKEKDHLFIVTNPAPLIFIGAMIKKLCKCRLYIIVHDVFPENLVAAGLLTEKSIVYKILLKLFNQSYYIADKLITCGSEMV